jgi:outer membrane protein TolC
MGTGIAELLQRARRGWAALAAVVVISSSAGAQAQAEDPMLAPPPEAQRLIHSWEEALSLVRAHSPDYRSNQDAVLRAEAQTRVALAAVLPIVNGQASYTHQFLTDTLAFGGASIVTPPQNVFAMAGTLSWTPLNARAIHGIGTAERNVDAAKLSFEERRRQIAVATVDAMLETLAADRVAELNRTGLRSALDRLTLTKTRLQFAQGTALDVDRAEQDVAAARALLISGDEVLRQARESLGVVIGSKIAASPPRDLDLDKLERAVASSCRLNEELERRPDIVAARTRVEIARRAITDAELMTAPTLGVTSQLAYNSQVTFGPLTTWLVAGVLSVPFYDGGARYGLLRDSRAAADQAEQALEAARLAAVVASARAHRAVAVTGASRDVARQQRDLAQRIDQRVREGYARGLGTSLDLVISAQALRQTEISLAVLEFQTAEARANAVLANAEWVY